MADLTKTGSQEDEWASITAATIREGTAIAIADDVSVSLEITVSKVEAVAHDGHAVITIEVSSNTSGDEDWTELVEYEITAETASTTTLDENVSPAAITVPLTSTTDFETKGDLYFIKNGTVANSEIVRNNGFDNDVSITILDGLTNTQASGLDIYTSVEQWIVAIPSEYRRCRVLVNNKDADCDIISRVRIAKATDIE